MAYLLINLLQIGGQQVWNERKGAKEGARILRILSMLVDTLLHDWYPAASPTVWIPCSFCGHPSSFTSQQCCKAMLLPPPSSGILQCPNCKAEQHVRDVAPDLALVDIAESYLMHPQDIQYVIVENEGQMQRKILGEGAYGTVYEAALSENSSMRVAVKELRNLEVLDETEHSQLLTEIWTLRYAMLSIHFIKYTSMTSLSCVQHPNVVKLYGVLLEDPVRIVMECVSGGSLHDFLHNQLKENALLTKEDPQWPLRIRVALDLARGVVALHSHVPPIIHRDIKSHNVLVWNYYRPHFF